MIDRLDCVITRHKVENIQASGAARGTTFFVSACIISSVKWPTRKNRVEGIARLVSSPLRARVRNARLFALEKRVAILHRTPSEISSFIRSLSIGTRDRWCYHTSTWRVVYNRIGRDDFSFLDHSSWNRAYILLSSLFSSLLFLSRWKIRILLKKLGNHFLEREW